MTLSTTMPPVIFSCLRELSLLPRQPAVMVTHAHRKSKDDLTLSLPPLMFHSRNVGRSVFVCSCCVYLCLYYDVNVRDKFYLTLSLKLSSLVQTVRLTTITNISSIFIVINRLDYFLKQLGNVACPKLSKFNFYRLKWTFSVFTIIKPWVRYQLYLDHGFVFTHFWRTIETLRNILHYVSVTLTFPLFVFELFVEFVVRIIVIYHLNFPFK